MPVACFRGLTTKFVYRFIYGTGISGVTPLPAAVSDAFGNPTTNAVTFNGETVVPCNNDGAVAQSVIGGPVAGTATISGQAYLQPIDLNLYGFSKNVSLWESKV
jgi:hypothetical protein